MTELTIRLANRPGMLASLTEQLADAGVNIEAVYLLHSSADGQEFAVAVDQLEEARSSLAIA